MRRALLAVHRWLGTALCLLVCLWFLSGIGMMYWGYPEVSDADRLERGTRLDPSTINISPTDIFAAIGLPEPPLDIRLQTYDGRPIYRYTDQSGESVVYADSGDFQVDVSQDLMLRVAAAWARQSAGAAVATRVDTVDQWTLQIPFADLQPLWKYAWPSGDEVYVSSVTGDVVQHTTRASRLGAYLGPVPHWLYFTPLRKHGAPWNRLVVWTSGAATVTAIVGLAIGVWTYLPRRRVPYVGQKWWHMVLGLTFGIGAVTWAFSGMLSMDPFPSLSAAAARRGAAMAIPSALRTRPSMADFFSKGPRAALAEVADLDVRELVMETIGGKPVYVATLAGGDTRIIPVDGSVRRDIDRAVLVNTITTAAAAHGGATIAQIDRYDAYYLDRRGELPLPVLLVRLNDADATRHYIDPKTARIVGSYNSRRWANRWLYHGLHSLDFPWLYQARPLWDIVVIAFMAGGTFLGVTSAVLAWRVVARTLTRAGRAGN